MSDQLPPMPEPVPEPMPAQASMPVSAPVSETASAGGKKGLAITSLILGILSLCAAVGWFCGGPISIAGLVVGFLGLKRSGKSMAVAGIVLSAFGLLLTIIFVIIGKVSGPIIQQIQNQIISNMGN